MKSRQSLAASSRAPARCCSAKRNWPGAPPPGARAGKVAAATAMAEAEEAAAVRRHSVVGTWRVERGLDVPATANEPCRLGEEKLVKSMAAKRWGRRETVRGEAK